MGVLKKWAQSWLGLDGEQIAKPAIRFTNKPVRSMRRLNENWIWFTADSEKLINYYTGLKGIKGKQDYFWAVTGYESNKKTHSGLPSAMVDAICNTTGVPQITTDEEYQERLNEIIEFNDVKNIIKQDMRAKTLVIGSGVLFVSNLKPMNDAFDKPIIEFVDERFCDIEMIGNIFVSATKKTQYKHSNKIYTHLEKRSYNLIENSLFCEDDNKYVELTAIPDTEHLEKEIEVKIDDVTAIPIRYKNGKDGSFGLSIYNGKLDLFDDYDQTCSQISELIRESSPITYMPNGKVETDKRTGNALTPNRYDKRYILLKQSKKQEDNDKIIIDQPQLNYRDMVDAGVDQLLKILTGVLAPATLGIEVQRNNNAEAMREKEKVTLVTRDDIIDNEMGVVSRLMNLAMKVYDYMDGKAIGDYKINVDYPDFSTPTFDAIVATMLPMWSAGAISPELFVKKLYEESLTDEEVETEEEYLKSNQTPTNYDFFGDTEPVDNRTAGGTQSEVDDVQ